MLYIQAKFICKKQELTRNKQGHEINTRSDLLEELCITLDLPLHLH